MTSYQMQANAFINTDLLSFKKYLLDSENVCT